MLDVFVGNARRRVKHVFYGWWIVAASFVIQALSGGLLLHGFTVYFLPLQQEFGWSRSLIASAFSLTRFESAFLGPIQGWAVDRFGSRIMVIIGMLLFGTGFIAFSMIQSVLTFLGAFLLLAMGASLGGFLPITATLTNWFAKKRTLAMGIAMTGMGAGGLLVALVAWSISTYDWRSTAFVSGLMIWLIGIPTALVLRHKPEPYGYLPDGETAPSNLDDEEGQNTSVEASQPKEETPIWNGMTAREAMRTSAFWFISLGHGSALLVVSAVSIHLVPHLVERMGLSLTEAGGITTFMLMMTVIGQLGGGYLADKFEKRGLLVACMLGHTAGLLLLAHATSVIHLFMFGILHGASWGARGPTQNSLRADYFGRAAFGTIMGFSSLIVMIGMITGPIFAGWMADQNDSYTQPFTILAVMTGFGSLFFLFTRRPKIPTR